MCFCLSLSLLYLWIQQVFVAERYSDIPRSCIVVGSCTFLIKSEWSFIFRNIVFNTVIEFVYTLLKWTCASTIVFKNAMTRSSLKAMKPNSDACLLCPSSY